MDLTTNLHLLCSIKQKLIDLKNKEYEEALILIVVINFIVDFDWIDHNFDCYHIGLVERNHLLLTQSLIIDRNIITH